MAFALLIAATVTPYCAAMLVSVSPFTTTWTCDDAAGLGIGAMVVVGVGAGVAAGDFAAGDVVTVVAGEGVARGAPDGNGLAAEAPAPSLRIASPIAGLAR